MTGAEIWMPENLVSDDFLLWSMNIPKGDFRHQNIHKGFWYPDYATCTHLKQVTRSNVCLRQHVGGGQPQIQVYKIPDSLTS